MPKPLPDDSLAARRVRRIARQQHGVVSRRQLYAAGVTRWQVTGQLRARRWQRVGDQSVCLHTGELSQQAHHWAAVFQGGPRAVLDASSALVAGGLEPFEPSRVRVSVPRGARVRRTPSYDIRQTRRWAADDTVVASGPPRVRPEVAAIRAALWAASEKQAVHLLSATVQQGLATPEMLAAQALRVRRDRRRLLVHEVVNELLDGARSLGEMDVARELARRGMPAPQRQVLRRGPSGRFYLDLYWPDWRLVVEVDGIHHTWAEEVVSDALRQNALALGDATVLRLPLLGLRLRPDEFFEQIRAALVHAGWGAPAA